MKCIKNPQTDIFYFLLRGCRALSDQQHRVAFNFRDFIFITNLFYNRIDQHVDDMRTMLQFGDGDKLGISADIRDQDGR